MAHEQICGDLDRQACYIAGIILAGGYNGSLGSALWESMAAILDIYNNGSQKHMHMAEKIMGS